MATSSEILYEMLSDDRSESKFFGENISSNNAVSSYLSMQEIPESKTNNVSFMKVEDLHYNCKSIVCVSDAYICYSCTQKRNILRLIHTVTGSKVILRGHESFILDMKFSSTNQNVLCSVDGQNNIIVWELSIQINSENPEQSILTQSIVFQLSFGALRVESHPVISNCFAICDVQSIGVFIGSKEFSRFSPQQRFADLDMNASFENETVEDIAFSSNGSELVASLLQQDKKSVIIRIWRISPDQTKLIQLFTTLPSKSPFFDTVFKSPIALRSVNGYLVLASKVSENVDNNDIDYQMQVWSYNTNAHNPAVLEQTITLKLPLFKSKLLAPSSSLKNPALEFMLLSEPSNTKYLVFTSRKSNLVVSFGVNPRSIDLSNKPSPLLFRLTYLDLTAPAISIDVTTILGRDHHSAEEGEHLEMSCYQEEAGDQASIQQYHVLLKNLFDFNSYLNSCSYESNKNDSELLARINSTENRSISLNSLLGSSTNTPKSEPVGRTILSLLNNANNQKSSFISSESDPIVLTPNSTPNNGINKNNPVGFQISPRLPTPKSTLSSSNLSDQMNNESNVLPVVSSPLVGLTAGKSILNLLNNTSATKANATQSINTPSNKTDNSNNNNNNNNNKSTSSVVGNDKDFLPDFLNFEPVKNTSILQMVQQNGALSNKPPLPSTAMTTTPIIGEESKEEKQSISKINNNDSTNGTKKTQANDDNSDNNNNNNNNKSQIAAPKVKTNNNNNSNNNSKNINISSNEIIENTNNDYNNSLNEIKDIVNTIADKIITKDSINGMKDDINKELKQSQLKTSDQISQNMKKFLEVEVKKSVESLLNNTKWKQELTSQLTDSLKAELLPNLTQKLSEQLKDVIKDSIKTSLSSSFRLSFENSILPAFQVGTDKLFNQIQSGFEIGMNGLAEENTKIARLNIVKELKETVRNLENVIKSLSLEITKNGIGMMNKSNSSIDLIPKEDAFTLLDKGLISEAILKALEDKDISITVSLLNRLTPAQVNAKCSSLARLCITQQLAADMSMNIPEE
eukprot:gene9485-12776_t